MAGPVADANNAPSIPGLDVELLAEGRRAVGRVKPPATFGVATSTGTNPATRRLISEERDEEQRWRERQADEERRLREFRRRKEQVNGPGKGRRHDRKPRTLWNQEEVIQLSRLWAEHGNRWSLIQRIDQEGRHILGRRSQVDLKDKVRNIKAWMLRNGIPVPAAMGGIRISDAKLQLIANALGEVEG